MSPVPARGTRHRLSAGHYRAEVSELGATLESLTVDGRDLLVTSPPEGPIRFYRGAIVAPWPNRIGDGRYTWDGEEIQAALNEPERGNALHGLVTFRPFRPCSDDSSAGTDPASSLTLRTVLHPSPAYPFTLELTVRHQLDATTGLTTTVMARNVGERDLPYGVCPHPYLVAGPEPLDTWTLQVRTGTMLQVTPDRLLPTGTAPVEPSGPFDFSAGRVIGQQELDHAFTDLDRDDGTATLTLTAPGGTGARLRFGTSCPWLQVHTGDRPEPENDRLGLAAEPMTCPPDAFRTGTDVVRLAPGQGHEASWSIDGW